MGTGDYYRMECATVDCPACGAVRGELCRGKNVSHYQGTGHVDRKSAFRQWAHRHKDKYENLKAQIVRGHALAGVPATNELYMGEN